MGGYFDHERLEVYAVAREVNRGVRDLVEELPRGFAESKDNLRRAAVSITRNVAEGSGKWKIADKVHFYRISHGSATEAAAALDELIDFGAVERARVVELHDLLARLAAMLLALIRSLQSMRGTVDGR